MRIRHPVGRAGRLWLLDRLEVAERAADILHRKQQALRHERERLLTLADRTAGTWTAAVRNAENWQRRTMILGARPSFRSAAIATGPATARIAWQTEMGVELPTEARCDLPEIPPLSGTPALAATTEAYRHALEAAVEHAAVTAALRRVDDELTVTERRVRAVRDRWVPELERTLRDLELRLDEHERDELVNSRVHHSERSPSTTRSHTER